MLELRRPPPDVPTGRRRRAAALALALLGALYLVALGVASTARVERALHARLSAALRARLGDVRLGEEVELDPLFRLSFGPLEIPAPGGGAPVVHARHGSARVSFAALLRGRVEPATILLGDVRVRPGPGGRDLRELLERARGGRRAFEGREAGAAAPGARELPKLKLRGLVVVLPVHGELELGPIDVDLKLARPAEGARMWATVSLRAGGRLALEAELQGGAWRARLTGEGLGPEALPPALRSRAAAVTGGAASLSIELETPADLSRGEARVSAGVEGLVLAGERIAAEPVGPLRATASGRVTWDRAARRVSLVDGVATFLRAASGTARAELHLGGPATFTAAVRADGVDWGTLVAALPQAVSLPPQAPRPAGTLSARLDLSGPLLAPDEWTVTAALDLAALREAARRAGRSPLAEPFVHRPPLDAGGHGPPLRIGPASPDFVPIAELPEYVVRAVTTSEDAGFFGHAGFDFDELKNAIAAGARRGRLVRGGSTISQQVAKNLFLGPERTFARKAREAAITVGLEATLPKRRILEIYLNVAEWGPGVWGIGPAARHWFGKDARTLTAKEAAFLASVIPSPVRYHEQLFARGALTEVWEARVGDLLVTMNRQGALSDGQLAAALAEPVTFASAATAAAATAAPDPGAIAAPAPAPAE
jgi:monofunctional biosynthetic peptidoglycan transglycosylase